MNSFEQPNFTPKVENSEHESERMKNLLLQAVRKFDSITDKQIEKSGFQA